MRKWLCGALCTRQIISPYYFHAPTVDSQVYVSMLRYYGLNHINQLPESPIFQQDGAPAHTANAGRNIWQENWEISGLESEGLRTGLEGLLTLHRSTSSCDVMWKIRCTQKKLDLFNTWKPELLAPFDVLTQRHCQKCGKIWSRESTVLFANRVSILSK